MKKVYFIGSAVINIILFLLSLTVYLIDYSEYPFSLVFFVPFIPLSMAVASIVSLKKNIYFRYCLLIKIVLFFFFFGLSFISFDDGIYAVVVFETVAFSLLLVTIYIYKNTGFEEKKSGSLKLVTPFEYKGKWTWDEAAAEYMKKTWKKSIDEFTDDDNNRVYRYAMMPVAYYFYWLLKKGFMSESFYTEIGNEISEYDMKNNNIDILGLLEDMDFNLNGKDMIKEAEIFSKYYLGTGFYSLTSENLIFDYYEEIKNPYGYYYCVDFSWDICKRMYERIECAYTKYLGDIETDKEYYEDNVVVRKIYSTRLKTELDIYFYGVKKKNITDEYVEKCINDLESISEYQFERIDKYVSNEYGDSLSGKVMSVFRPYSMFIFESDNQEDVMYVISGESDFEEEHGFSLYVRNGVVFKFGYGYDFYDMYSYDCVHEYEIFSNKTDFSSIESLLQVEKLIESGDLVKTHLIPSELGGSDDEENIIVLTPHALKEKEIADIRLQAIFASWGRIPKYTYEAIYHDENKKFVPKLIRIRDNQDVLRRRFAFYVNVWY